MTKHKNIIYYNNKPCIILGEWLCECPGSNCKKVIFENNVIILNNYGEEWFSEIIEPIGNMDNWFEFIDS